MTLTSLGCTYIVLQDTSALGVLFIAEVNLKCRLSISSPHREDKSDTSLALKHVRCHSTLTAFEPLYVFIMHY